MSKNVSRKESDVPLKKKEKERNEDRKKEGRKKEERNKGRKNARKKNGHFEYAELIIYSSIPVIGP
jgi:hypothetical protein